MKTIIDPNYPVHFVNAFTKNLALCGSGWLQATGSEDLVTCRRCKLLLISASRRKDVMDTIKLPDGYNGDFVECECEPIEKNGDNYKLRVKCSSYLIKWCSREQWESAMWKAYTSEIESSINNEYANYEAEAYREEERRQKYQQWLEEK